MINWNSIELKWRKIWENNGFFKSDVKNTKKKFITVAYPYPNSPQHIGHGRTYTIADVNSRFLRMQGFNVLFPMGFHYTGTPILSIAKKFQKKDKEISESFDRLYKIPQSIISHFTEPIKIAQYFHNEIKKGMIEMGYSIDWRREFTTIDPLYKKFIEWQFSHLQNKELIIQGTHPVGWCPADKNPVSQHDTIGDIEPNFIEYTIIKFYYNEYILPAATLRPETIFGVTNIWINPELMYDIIDVNNEKWIVSTGCSYKLQFLYKNISHVGKIQGRRLLYKKVKTFQNNEIVTLPATFVKNEIGTGIVMSVPAHAPYDYQALVDLKNKNNLITENIKPIILIDSKEPNVVPSQEMINKLNIQNQHDLNLTIATNDLYKHEFNFGKLNENAGKFSGMRVKKAKEAIKSWIIKNYNGTTLLELSESVTCRCGAKCVVNMLDNQWFLNYGDENWKSQTLKHIKNVDIIPTEIKIEFERIIDWLKERACARQQGLGTNLTWDKNWIIESLSDSTIYMAYYIISKYINNNDISIESNISNSFFDYVLLGIGKSKTVALECKITEITLSKIRNEFLYFYPVDYRHSGRDLITNHLTFFIMNHVAIFSKQHWPKKIVVNGSVLMNGKKMSKSIGNTFPLRDAIKKYGADPVRISMIITSELLQDVDFNLEHINKIQFKLESILTKCIKYGKNRNNVSETKEDKWLLSRLNFLISSITDSMTKIRFRDALNKILYDFDNDMNWYLRRINSKYDEVQSTKAIHDFLSNRVLMLSPFSPHIAEEMWEKLGNSKTVSEHNWPKLSYEYNTYIIHSENFVKSVMEDINNIIKVTKIIPKRIIIYTANELKISIYKKILELMNESYDTKKLIRDIIFSDAKEIRKYANFINKAIKDISLITAEEKKIRKKLSNFDEKTILNSELSPLIKKELDIEIKIYSESDSNKYDPSNKSIHSRPFKPAILIE